MSPLQQSLMVRYEVRFGKARYYPMDTNARIILSLLNQQSFTREQMLKLQQVFRIEITTPGASLDTEG